MLFTPHKNTIFLDIYLLGQVFEDVPLTLCGLGGHMTPLHSCELSEIEQTDLSIVSAKHAQITEMYLTESTRVVKFEKQEV